MELNNASAPHEHTKLRCTIDDLDQVSASPVEITFSPRSSMVCHDGDGSSRGSTDRHDCYSCIGRKSFSKIESSKGEGTLELLSNNGKNQSFDCDAINHYSDQENKLKESCDSDEFDEFRKKATVIIEEYFATDDVVSAASELRYLNCPFYHYYFIKKLVSMALDRHDKEKEMAAILLSTLYADFVEPGQVYKGFSKLVQSSDDLYVDIPDVVDVIALFIARAIVDDILPPAFLTKELSSISEDSKGIDVLKRAEKGYLSAPLHAEIVLHRWGGSKSVRVEDIKTRISELLREYLICGDKLEASRCIKGLKVPFFHHEIVKQALVLAMEKQSSKMVFLDLLKQVSEEGIINASQITKGFSRLIDVIDDLCLDIPNARESLQSLISSAASEGWLCASSLKPLSYESDKVLEDDRARVFKMKAAAIIQEYFLTGDILEVMSSLESESPVPSTPLTAIFVKKLITMAMGRKNKEKERASVLLTAFPADGVLSGFLMLIDSAEDTTLDNPTALDDLAMFLARAVVDEVLAPSQLDEIRTRCESSDSVGSKVLQTVRSLLGPRLSAERILRCWGGGGSSRSGWEIEDVKEKIAMLLEEYESSGDTREAFRCIKELGMPFFHHEVVKRALVSMMERKNDRLWSLLGECFSVGLITPNQMVKGFERVADSADDLVLDIPDVISQYVQCVEKAKSEGWLDPSFSSGRHS